MAVTYPTAVETARMQAVLTAVGSTGVLEIGTTGMASILATIALDSTPGSVTNGVWTIFSSAKSDTSADNTGTAAAARIRTATGGTDIVTGLTVGTSGSDINLGTTSIVSGYTVTVNSATITHA
jgi:hypothetical protein